MHRFLSVFVLRRRFYAGVVGIVREEKNRWECRAPLTPKHVQEIQAKHGIRTVVQPCSRRIFSNDQYRQAGATVGEDLSGCDLILGIKEVPISKLIPQKAYMFFSHTHKGQRHNLPLLRAVCERKITLMDYELLTDEQGARLVAFGRFAGYAGMINALHGLGDRLLTRKIRTPFLRIPMTQHLDSLEEARKLLASVGRDIAQTGLHEDISPVVVVFTGRGNVSQGAQEIFKTLPHEWIEPKELRAFVQNKAWRRDRLYGCVVGIEDYIENKDNPGQMVDVNEYLKRPDEFTSLFHERIAPYCTLLVNGIYWEARYPRLLDEQQLQTSCPRLVAIADISCDLGGSLKFMDRATSIDRPFFYYDPETDSYSEEPSAAGVQIMSIDNLPTQLPRDSSEHFSSMLVSMIPDLLEQRKDQESVVKRAKITERGVIVPELAFLNDLVRSEEQKSTGNADGGRVLILGSGYVVPPVLEYLSRQGNLRLTIATNTPALAKTSLNLRNDMQLVEIDATKEHSRLDELVASADVVISLVAATMHVPIAEACIRNKKHLVTASYISPAMSALDAAARAADVLLLNEIGLDPGLDHLAAMEIIDGAKGRGQAVESFVSWCGGLPAPEFADNPLGYKFSWSPRGVLLATGNPAKFMQNGQVIEVEGERLLSSARGIDIHPALRFEGLPNRDSMKYVELYGLDRDRLKTMFRGTLRYQGFCRLMDQFKELGLLSVAAELPGSWLEYLMTRLESRAVDATVLAARLGLASEESLRLFESLKWLGLLSSKPEPKDSSRVVLDRFCALLEEKLKYGPGERDMAFLRHEFLLSGSRKIAATLCAFGDEKYSAMARTVGYPAAVAAKLILDGEIPDRGVRAPLSPTLYGPILRDLRRECGIRFKVEETVL